MTQTTITITTGRNDVIVKNSVSQTVEITPVVKSIVQAFPAGLKGDTGDLPNTFETISKNLAAVAFVINYDLNSNISKLIYENGIIKTLSYTSGRLTQITLSGSTPSGINLIKTLFFTGDNLTSVTYE
jgi:hypothetical protein